MSGLTITNLAQQVQDLLDKTKQQNTNLAAWLGGSADGGPNNDGLYPFVDLTGREILVPAPAKLADTATGPAAQAVAAMLAAQASERAAGGSASHANDQRILAEAARGAAVEARNLAQEHRNHAGTSEANARYWAELAQSKGEGSSEDRALVEQLAEEVADNAALAAQDAQDAAASAALAATFDPNLFDKKSDTLSATRLVDMIDPARIPVLVGQTPIVSSGGISNLTAQQQTGIMPGTLVATTDGRRWVYSGTGSKTAEPSYIEQGDVTPIWDVIAGKPSFFPTNIENVAGLASALSPMAKFVDRAGAWTRHQTDHGYIDIGPANTNYAHLYTDRPSFYFNAPILVNGQEVYTRGNLAPMAYLGTLSTHDLDTIVATGIYHQNANANATASPNYPVGQAGMLEVLESGSFVYQRYTTYQTGNEVYTRSRYSGNWSLWQKQWSDKNFNPSTKANLTGAAFTGGISVATDAYWTTGGTVAAQLEHIGGHFFVRPFNSGSGYDDGSFLRGYWRGSTGNLVLTKVGGSGPPLGILLEGVGQVWHEGNLNPISSSGGTISGALSFGSVARQMLNLYSTGYGVGVQSSTLYVRTGSRFSIHTGGSHSATENDPGGGTTLFTVDKDEGIHTPLDMTVAGEVNVSGGWLRVHGDRGFYCQTHGGGWYMTDSTWLRSYSNKSVVTSGTIQMGAFTVTSDIRLKTDIAPITNAADIIDATNVYEFTKAGKRMYGMIAQEARAVAPILVSDSADLHPEDGDPILALDQTGYIPLLIDEVKSLRRRVRKLEGSVA